MNEHMDRRGFLRAPANRRCCCGQRTDGVAARKSAMERQALAVQPDGSGLAKPPSETGG